VKSANRADPEVQANNDLVAWLGPEYEIRKTLAIVPVDRTLRTMGIHSCVLVALPHVQAVGTRGNAKHFTLLDVYTFLFPSQD
jgi:hypothetical protein